MKYIGSFVFIIYALLSTAQNTLYIPPILTGTNFNLTVQSGTTVLYGNTPTPTYGINGVWMSPTIAVNKDDSITLNVINNLPVRTTMHWHGLHVSPENDGGPHQTINPGSTWSPSFKVRNNAATFWYHPHGAGQTDIQVSKGLAGFFIVRDAAEAALNLPRTYGVDDIPLNIQSKAFDNLLQIAIASDMDTALLVNGTINPQVDVPAQVVRFRLLNGSSLRSYNFGLSNGQHFYQIATDGGLLDTPVMLTRLRLSPGERAEILVNFSAMVSQQLYLKSFASELPSGIYGADTVGDANNEIHDYEDNFLNGADFNLLQINVVAATANPVSTVPASLVPLTPFDPATVTNTRAIVMDTIRLLPIDVPNLAEGPFGMNNRSFDMEYVNDTVHLNATEIWVLKNNTMVAHPFHIHDIQFNVIEKNGMPPAPTERGWKDVILVMPHDSVKFITKFETFSHPTVPYMYHCHLLHHEDDGMMGSFVVIDTLTTGISSISDNIPFRVFPNPANTNVTIELAEQLSQAVVTLQNVLGEMMLKSELNGNSNSSLDLSSLTPGIYFLQVRSGNRLSTRKLIKQ
jgi:blue copper oxidase